MEGSPEEGAGTDGQGQAGAVTDRQVRPAPDRPGVAGLAHEVRAGLRHRDPDAPALNTIQVRRASEGHGGPRWCFGLGKSRLRGVLISLVAHHRPSAKTASM